MIRIFSKNIFTDPFVPVDEWIPNSDDEIFKAAKGFIQLPVSDYYGLDKLYDENGIEIVNPLDIFMLTPKKCYYGDAMIVHIPQYLNYFERYYDRDHELLMVYYRMKYMIDYRKDSYTIEMFFSDLNRLIMSNSIMMKAHMMNEDNYMLSLDTKNYRNNKNPSLQYTDRHAKILSWMSLMYNMMIPLLTHFIYVKGIPDVNQFLLREVDYILDYIDREMGVDIESKIYETAFSNTEKNSKDNAVLWDMQDIRSINTTIHSLDSRTNILLNIIPKYQYSQNLIYLNYTSIRKSTKYNVTEIDYEFNYVPLSSSKRDSEQNSEFDKFESYLVKENEAIYLHLQASSDKTIQDITYKYGPFDQNEINYYMERLKEGDHDVINGFQKNLIFDLFYKEFGEPLAAYAINHEDYIKLLIAAKKILKAHNMIALPYIISSKMERVNLRKSINKKELTKIQASKYYKQIQEKYQNEKIEQYILSIIATILVSEFRIIDYYDKELDGQLITGITDLITEEVMMFITLI